MGDHTQSIDAKRAETERPYAGEDILKNKKLGKMYWQRAVQTIIELEHLEKKDIIFDPFLEIGAGGAQRSIALINQYSTDGAAIDISFNSLRNAPFIMSLFKYDKSPLLICLIVVISKISVTLKGIIRYPVGIGHQCKRQVLCR